MSANTAKERLLSVGVLVIHFYMFHACEKYSFVKDDDVELKDHVITTMTTPYVEICRDRCVWTMNCFSINVRSTRFGTVECDLNNSSKKASPGKLVPTQGSQYQQMSELLDCEKYQCRIKERLPDGWYRFNNKSLKNFHENKTWADARAHCQSLGGDLVSIATALQNEFVYNAIVKGASSKDSTKGSDLQGLTKHWSLDGSDAGVNLTGDSFSPRYELIDGEKALYFPGFKGYATIPAVPLNPEGYTFMLFVKPGNQSADMNGIFSDWYFPHVFGLFIHRPYKSILYYLKNEGGEHISTYYLGLSMKEWTHIAVTWNKTAKQVKIAYNGIHKQTTDIQHTDLALTTHAIYHLGTVGDDLPKQSNSYKAFHGYLKHLMVFSKTIEIEDVQTAMYYTDKGPWIGLSAQDNTDTFKWSDGTSTQFLALPSYQPNPSLSGRKCVSFGRNGKWLDKFCDESKPFICQKTFT